MRNCDWEQRELKEILKVNSGRDYKHLGSGSIPVYGTGGYMLSVNDKLSDKDAIGIGRKGTIDKPQYLKAPFWTVDTLFFMIPLNNFDLQFLYTMTQKINWKKMDESTGVPSLSKAVIEKVKQNIPSYQEQIKIGDFFKQLDDTIALHQRKLTLLKQLKQTYLQALFPQSEMNIPTLRFAGFYDPWEQRNVSSLAKETYGGGTPRTGVKKYWKGSSPWIQSSDLSINQLHNVQPTKFITEEAIKQSATHNVPDNSIAIVTRVGVGKLALMPYSYSEYCKCIEPPVRRNEPLNARNRASYCEQESRPTIFIYRTNLLYNEVACLRA